MQHGQDSQPDISVIMPIYNGERYLQKAVASILRQDYPSFELILLDDGSSDSTPGLLQRFAAQDPRVRFVPQPHKGLVATLNNGIALARGSYIARMDADDIAYPKRLSLQVAFLRSHPRVAAVGGQIRSIDQDGHPHRLQWRYPTHPAEVRKLLESTSPLAHSAVMYRRDAVLAVGGYRPFTAAEDYDLWWRLAESHELANLSQTILEYRIHDAAESTQKTHWQAVSATLVYCNVLRRQNGQAEVLPSQTQPHALNSLYAILDATGVDGWFFWAIKNVENRAPSPELIRIALRRLTTFTLSPSQIATLFVHLADLGDTLGVIAEPGIMALFPTASPQHLLILLRTLLRTLPQPWPLEILTALLTALARPEAEAEAGEALVLLAMAPGALPWLERPETLALFPKAPGPSLVTVLRACVVAPSAQADRILPTLIAALGRPDIDSTVAGNALVLLSTLPEVLPWLSRPEIIRLFPLASTSSLEAILRALALRDGGKQPDSLGMAVTIIGYARQRTLSQQETDDLAYFERVFTRE